MINVHWLDKFSCAVAQKTIDNHLHGNSINSHMVGNFRIDGLIGQINSAKCTSIVSVSQLLIPRVGEFVSSEFTDSDSIFQLNIQKLIACNGMQKGPKIGCVLEAHPVPAKCYYSQ